MELKMLINNDICWRTGIYSDSCDCEFCSHKDECSGYEGGDDDD